MVWKNKNIYWETSALNYFFDRFEWNDTLATKCLQKVKGNIYYLSPITIWEILLTKSSSERENIIFKAQHLFSENLLKAPSEFILNFISQGCPLIEKKYNINSNLTIADTWRELCKDSRLTFIYDFDEMFEHSKYLRELSKQIRNIVNKIYIGIKPKDLEFQYQTILDNCYSMLNFTSDENNEKTIKIHKLSILFIIYFICIGVEFDNSLIRNFWAKKNIAEVVNRIEHIIQNYEVLVYRGPFVEMALMAYTQVENNIKSNRGLIFDCLHTIYLTYIDAFITNDNHFRKLRDLHPHTSFLRVYHIDELNIITYDRNIEIIHK